MRLEPTDPRVAVPIFTPGQVAEFVGMPASTVRSWMRPTPTRPVLVHSVRTPRRGWPSIPLLGIAEAQVLRGMRDTMRMSKVAQAVELIRERGGEYALGNEALFHDGWDLYLRQGDGDVTSMDERQVLLPGIIEERLRPFRVAPDGFIEALMVSKLPETEIDPRFVSGRPRFTKTGVPVFVVAGMLAAGEPADLVAREYGVELALVQEVERLAESDPDWLASVA